MTLLKPYTIASNNGLQPYTAQNNFAIRDPKNVLELQLKNSVSKAIALLWLKTLFDMSFDRKPPFRNPHQEVIPNAMLPINQIKIWEFWGQRNALNRSGSLIRLAKNFDYKQFEPLKIAMIEGEDSVDYFCYDGGGRLHILYACGFTDVPCFVVKLKNKSELQKLFLDQKKFVATINTETRYIQDLAFIEHTQVGSPKTWYSELDIRQKYSYNLAKLLDFCSIGVDADCVSGIGMLSKGYSTFCHKNTNSKPTYNGTVPNEAYQLADSFKMWTSLLNKHFPKEKKRYMGSVVLYTGATLWRLSEVEKKTKLKHNTKLKYPTMRDDLQESFEESIIDFKRKYPNGKLKEYYDRLLDVDIQDGLTGVSRWGKRDHTPADTAILGTYFGKKNLLALHAIFTDSIPTML